MFPPSGRQCPGEHVMLAEIREREPKGGNVPLRSHGLSAAHGICNGKKIPWEGELNLRFDP